MAEIFPGADYNLNRSELYLERFPEDEPAAMAIRASLIFGAFDVRTVVDRLAGKPLSDPQWELIRHRWTRAWNAIVGGQLPETPNL
jgi:hypothetical protein